MAIRACGADRGGAAEGERCAGLVMHLRIRFADDEATDYKPHRGICDRAAVESLSGRSGDLEETGCSTTAGSTFSAAAERHDCMHQDHMAIRQDGVPPAGTEKANGRDGRPVVETSIRRP